MDSSGDRMEGKFFWGLVGGVVVLAVAALAVALARRHAVAYRQDDTPEAVVYDFLLALQRGEPEVAYALLGKIPCKPSLDDFSERASLPASLDISLGPVRQEGRRAWVTLRFRYSAGPFSEGTGPSERVVLQQENGHWKIVRLPPELWPFSPPWPEGQCPPSRGGD